MLLILSPSSSCCQLLVFILCCAVFVWREGMHSPMKRLKQHPVRKQMSVYGKETYSAAFNERTLEMYNQIRKCPLFFLICFTERAHSQRHPYLLNSSLLPLPSVKMIMWPCICVGVTSQRRQQKWKVNRLLRVLSFHFKNGSKVC